MNQDPHHRFRERIQQLLDDNEQLRAKLGRCRQQHAKDHQRIRVLEQSRQLWRQRATT